MATPKNSACKSAFNMGHKNKKAKRCSKIKRKKIGKPGYHDDMVIFTREVWKGTSNVRGWDIQYMDNENL